MCRAAPAQIAGDELASSRNHGWRGAKDTIPVTVDWKKGDWKKALADKPDQELFNDIRKGKGDKMPPEDTSRAKDDDIWNIIHYIRAMSKGQPSAPAAPAPAPPAPTAAAPSGK